jgi:ABC-type dipeptide/oligopeptide/nickel transport system permease component
MLGFMIRRILWLMVVDVLYAYIDPRIRYG